MNEPTRARRGAGKRLNDFERGGFNDRASSVIVTVNGQGEPRE